MSQNFTSEDTQLAEMRPSIGSKLPHPSDSGTVTITISREVLHRYINYGEFAPAVHNTLAAALDEGPTEAQPITITIRREDAEHWAQHHPRAIGQYEQRIANAIRAALEGER